MKILTDKEFSSKAIGEMMETEPQKSEIYINEHSTGTHITGTALEASIKWNEFYLAFMTDDIPQEDRLRIHFMDSELHLKDSITLGSPYSTGSFRSLEVVEPNMVYFRFIDETQWKVELSSIKHFCVPYLSEPKGVHRKFKFNRYFKITGIPDSERG